MYTCTHTRKHLYAALQLSQLMLSFIKAQGSRKHSNVLVRATGILLGCWVGEHARIEWDMFLTDSNFSTLSLKLVEAWGGYRIFRRYSLAGGSTSLGEEVRHWGEEVRHWGRRYITGGGGTSLAEEVACFSCLLFLCFLCVVEVVGSLTFLLWPALGAMLASPLWTLPLTQNQNKFFLAEVLFGPGVLS